MQNLVESAPHGARGTRSVGNHIKEVGKFNVGH